MSRLGICSHSGLVVALLSAALPARAEVFVLGNTETGHVIIRGNSEDAGGEANREAKGIRDTGWVMLYGDDAPGWGAIACVRTDKGVHFELASGHPSEMDAVRLAQAAGQKVQKQTGGTLMVMCAPRWNNRGQPLAFGSEGAPDKAPPPGPVDGAINAAKGVIRQNTTLDYQKHCVRPKAPVSAKAELNPIRRGAAQLPDKRPPAKSTPAWKPDPRCPKRNYSSSGVRG